VRDELDAIMATLDYNDHCNQRFVNTTRKALTWGRTDHFLFSFARGRQQ